jgi:hypothetical protein
MRTVEAYSLLVRRPEVDGYRLKEGIPRLYAFGIVIPRCFMYFPPRSA